MFHSFKCRGGLALAGACGLAVACSDSTSGFDRATDAGAPADANTTNVTVQQESGTDSGSPPDGDAGCTIITPSALKLTNSQFTPTRFSGDLVENLGAPNHADDAGVYPWDRIHIDLSDPGVVGAGPVDLGAGDQSNTSTCKECVRVYEDFSVSGASLVVSKVYFQASGTMTVEVRSVNDAGIVNGAQGTLKNVVLREVMQGDGGLPGPLPPGRAPSTAISGGACLVIPSSAFRLGLVDGGVP
jgi:hypothetical protein